MEFARTRMAWASLLALAVLGGPAPASAADKEVVAKTRKFLETESRAKTILFFMHPTATFEKIEHTRTVGVLDPRTKKERKGHFRLAYRFRWKSGLSDDDHTTALEVFFDEKGKLVRLVGGKTTAAVEPFAAPDVVLAAVADQLLETLADDAEARRVAKKLIEGRDVQRLLAFMLRRAQK